MDLERAFDQIVFGTTTPKLETCLGLFLSPEALYLTEVRLKDGKPVADQLFRAPIPQAPEAADKSAEIRTSGSLNTAVLSDPEPLAGILRQALTQIRPRSSHVIVSLASPFGLLRYFTIPPMDSRFWRTAVPAEARKLIPIPFNELVYDFQVRPIAPASGKQTRHGVLFGVVHRKNLAGINALIQKLGLTLFGIELAPCSVERLCDTVAASGDPKASYAHLHLEGNEGHVLLSQNGWPILFRTVQIAPEAGPIERRKVDVPGSVDFALKQLGAQPPAHLRLSGTHRDLAGWGNALAQELGIGARVAESAKALGLKAEEWGTYACAGAALRYVTPTAIAVDMSQYSRISDEDRGVVYTLFKLVGVAACVFAMIGAVRYAEALKTGSVLSRLHKKISAIQEFRNKTPDQITELNKELEDKLATVNVMTSPKPPLMKIFEAIQEDIPGPVWIERMEYAGHVGGRKRDLGLSGRVSAADVDAEQEMVNRFQEKLKGDERLGRALACGAPSVQVSQTDSPSQEKIRSTTFTIACSGRAGGS